MIWNAYCIHARVYYLFESSIHDLELFFGELGASDELIQSLGLEANILTLKFAEVRIWMAKEEEKRGKGKEEWGNRSMNGHKIDENWHMTQTLGNVWVSKRRSEWASIEPAKERMSDRANELRSVAELASKTSRAEQANEWAVQRKGLTEERMASYVSLAKLRFSNSCATRHGIGYFIHSVDKALYSMSLVWTRNFWQP